MVRSRFFFLSALALALAACQGKEATVFPPGLEPLEDDPVPPPAATAGENYPELLSLEQGMDTSNYVHATAYVHGSVAQVWDAMKDWMVVVDRRNVTTITSSPGTEPEYEVDFLTHYTINDVVTVMFDLTWREGQVSGTTDHPTRVSIVYQKTFGSTFVMLMRGSIELEEVAPGVTMLSFAQRMNAVSTSSDNIASWTRDMYASILARVHGQPLPTYM